MMHVLNHLVHGACYAAIFVAELYGAHGLLIVKLGGYGGLAALPFVAASHAAFTAMRHRR